MLDKRPAASSRRGEPALLFKSCRDYILKEHDWGLAPAGLRDDDASERSEASHANGATTVAHVSVRDRERRLERESVWGSSAFAKATADIAEALAEACPWRSPRIINAGRFAGRRRGARAVNTLGSGPVAGRNRRPLMKKVGVPVTPLRRPLRNRRGTQLAAGAAQSSATSSGSMPIAAAYPSRSSTCSASWFSKRTACMSQKASAPPKTATDSTASAASHSVWMRVSNGKVPERKPHGIGELDQAPRVAPRRRDGNAGTRSHRTAPA